MVWRVGVDSGGTFTDICFFEAESRRLEVWKISSTPHDPSIAITSGLEEGARRFGINLDEIEYLGHGTTVATNALIQKRGVKTALITTKGFRDLLEIGRQKRPSLFDMHADKPVTLVPRHLRFEVGERVLQSGKVELPLDQAELREVIEAIRAAGIEAVVVCLLYSYAHPGHEQEVLHSLEGALPGTFTSISSSVAPEFREFERLSTAVVNGYLGPIMDSYIKRLVERLQDMGIDRTVYLTQSNGGVISPDDASRYPVRTILSGPSTGVVAARSMAQAAGVPNLITFDMGGTSCDVSLMTNYEFSVVMESNVHGYPIKMPMIDIHTVGAGGGSIAYVDNGGHLKVGPRSAGADPGPACYGKGNDEPTVTDANVLLHYMNSESLLDGRLAIDKHRSRIALERVAEPMGLSAERVADGILEIVTANMAKAIRVISVQRGYDPRDYALMAFGGAGPLHACRLATHLGIRTIVVPPSPGLMCALGLLMTDLRSDFAATRIASLADLKPSDLQMTFAELEQRAHDWFDLARVGHEHRSLTRSIDVRYVGQNYEISVPMPAGEVSQDHLAIVRKDFLQSHKREYGFADEANPIQFVTYRVHALGHVAKVEMARSSGSTEIRIPKPSGTREIWDSGLERFVTADLHDRADLAPGHSLSGPAVVDQMDTTTFVPRGFALRVDNSFNLLIEEI